MEDKKYIKIRLSTVALLFVIAISLIIIVVEGWYIYKNRNNNKVVNEVDNTSFLNTTKEEQEKSVSEIVETKIIRDEDGNVKTIVADLNNDGKAETVEFYYIYEDLGTEPPEKYISKIQTNLIENDGKKEYTKDFKEAAYLALEIEVVDIDKQDNYKEIKISYIPTDGSPQWYYNYFLKYDGYDYDLIKINRTNNEYLMYEEEKYADDYIISAIGDNGNKLSIENGKIKAYSFIEQEETFDLKSNGQLVLTSAKFVGSKDMYTEYFKLWGPGIIFEDKDVYSNSNVYGVSYIDTEYMKKMDNFEVLKVEDHWLEVNINNNIGYMSFNNAYNEPGTKE